MRKCSSACVWAEIKRTKRKGIDLWQENVKNEGNNNENLIKMSFNKKKVYKKHTEKEKIAVLGLNLGKIFDLQLWLCYISSTTDHIWLNESNLWTLFYLFQITNFYVNILGIAFSPKRIGVQIHKIKIYW